MRMFYPEAKLLSWISHYSAVCKIYKYWIENWGYTILLERNMIISDILEIPLIELTHNVEWKLIDLMQLYRQSFKNPIDHSANISDEGCSSQWIVVQRRSSNVSEDSKFSIKKGVKVFLPYFQLMTTEALASCAVLYRLERERAQQMCAFIKLAIVNGLFIFESFRAEILKIC